MKQNCWEFFKCGREPGGLRAVTEGVCPATNDQRCDRVNRGTNAGRSCWLVAGTLGAGPPSCDLVRTQPCTRCDFFHLVQREEGGEFQRGALLTGASRSLAGAKEIDLVTEAFERQIGVLSAELELSRAEVQALRRELAELNGLGGDRDECPQRPATADHRPDLLGEWEDLVGDLDRIIREAETPRRR